MKKLSIALLFVSGSIMLMSSSCKKPCMAGSGGDVTILFKPEHHTIPITGSSSYTDTVYIKYNSSDFPGPSPSNYDMVVAGNPGENFVRVPGLKCGQYFVFAVGFDTSAAWNIRVIGGLPIDFSDKSGTLSMTVPVNE
jgi:hypothetical protein